MITDTVSVVSWNIALRVPADGIHPAERVWRISDGEYVHRYCEDTPRVLCKLLAHFLAENSAGQVLVVSDEVLIHYPFTLFD